MPFDIPKLPAAFRCADWELSVHSHMDLDDEELDRILGSVSKREQGNAHSHRVMPVKTETRSFELSCLLAVHSRDEERERGAFAHFGVWVELDARPSSREHGDDWDALFSAVGAERPSLTAVMSSAWRFPTEDATFGVELPIPIDNLDGFVEISGVRLSQKDPDTGRILYSLILDYIDEYRVVQVTTDIQVENNRRVLISAWKRALDIAGLTVEPPIRSSGDGTD